jgi:signal transduction histidine kinase/CheY-like chemotaxis protein/HAMP domain-containing protein
MRLSFRSKLIAIVATAALAFIVLLVSSATISNRTQDQLTDIEKRYLPRLELGPRLETQFEHLQRGLQDAVAARDAEALEATRATKDGLLAELAAARTVADPMQAALLRNAIEDYYAAAYDVSRRILGGETGESLVRWMGSMQTKQAHAARTLKETTAFDRSGLARAFAAASEAQAVATKVRFAVIIGCLVVVVLLSLRLSRGVLGALSQLTIGLRRFGDGDFRTPIPVVSSDELGEVARQANQMAAGLSRLGSERDRSDWLKAGQAGLVVQVRGELEQKELADRATTFLAQYLTAAAGALYLYQPDGSLKLIGQYALSAGDGAGQAAPIFRRGEGLVGQAALVDHLTVVTDPPADFLRVRSGLGEGAPRVLVFQPIMNVGRVTGVIELGLFRPWTEVDAELLATVRDPLAIALDGARSRAATRDLLAETQRQAERLSSQEEELRAINEELQTQQDELRQTNTELGLRARELEDQRRILEDRNLELSEARTRLEHKASELTTVSSYKSQFLANMSHELRTPLNSMLLLSNLLADNESGNLSEKQVEFARTVHAAGKDLLALINQVLDLAKIESGKQEVRNEPVALQAVVEHLGRVFQPLARDKGLEFVFTVSPSLPSTINTDRRRLEQVLNNLLGNAIKFTPTGTVTLTVDRPPAGGERLPGDLPRARAVAFTVTDTGLGIAPGDQQRVFAPFEQVDAATDRRYGGTGLGLAISRQLAELLGGALSLQSTLGQGSTFTCVIPEEPPPARGGDAILRERPAISTVDGPGRQESNFVQAASSPASNGAAPVNGTTGDGADASLLLIEDDTVFSNAFGDIIRDQGLQCLIATKGQDGLRLAKERKPKGIILDVRLPDIDGWAVIAALRADPETASIPVHFVSALDAADRGLALGAVGYLSKPASHRELEQVVEALVPKQAERPPRVLVVEDDVLTGESLVRRLSALTLDVHHVTSARHALQAVRDERFAFMILDLSLPDMDGLQLLRSLQEQCGSAMPSVVVYTARALSKAEVKMLETYTEAVVLKEGASAERLIDEVRMFVRRLKEGLGMRRLRANHNGPVVTADLKGKTVLIADDDMRALYALSATLRAKGLDVLTADTGVSALAVLAKHPEVNAVLMDIMMPEMDGYEAMRRIRRDVSHSALPIIALTAKAMAGDEQKCLEAGATAYLPKPIDPDRLLALLSDYLGKNGSRVA